MKSTYLKDKIEKYYKQLLESNYLIREINLRNEVFEKQGEVGCPYVYTNGYLAAFHGDKYQSGKLYIYIKPFSIPTEQAHVSILHTGSPVIEYYNGKSGKWQVVDINQGINMTENIRLRICMNPTDIVFAISIVVPKADLEQNHKIIRNIDFSEDLLEEMPVKYQVDAEKSRKLTFIYEDVYEVKHDDYELAAGDIKFDGNGVTLIPNHGYGDSQSYSDGSYMVKRSIDEEIDTVYLEFLKDSRLSTLSILLINKPYYDALVRIKDRLEEHSGKALLNTGSKGLMLSFFENNYISIVDRFELTDNYMHQSYVASDLKIGVEFCLKDNCIRINGESICLNRSVTLEDKNYLYFWAARNQCIEDIGISINEVKYRRKSGFLYVKPFKNNYGSIKVLLMDNGEAYIEFYQESSGTWKRTDANSTISERDIRMRIKMTPKSEVYNIFIVSAD